MQFVLLHFGKNLQTVELGVARRLTGLKPNGILIDEAKIETVAKESTDACIMFLPIGGIVCPTAAGE